MKYLLIDTANTFFRARHSAHRAADSWTKVGFALHVTLMSINKVARRFGADHVIFALEGRSWRKDYYEPYKKNRAVARGKMNETEQEEDKLFWETYDSLTKYLTTKTNCSVIRHPEAEADDIIARWIALHPQDDHVIISSDSDYVQLIAPNVRQYNGITDELITLEGYFDAKDKPINDKKTKQPKTLENPQWLLFEKCMRGDTSDNVFSAYPGVREKGTKNKVGLREAFADRDKRGYNWNNMMLQRWTDHNGEEHKVLDDYERNRLLIDLSMQPADLVEKFDALVASSIVTVPRKQVGLALMKFCNRHGLVKIEKGSGEYSSCFSSAYTGVLLERIREQETVE